VRRTRRNATIRELPCKDLWVTTTIPQLGLCWSGGERRFAGGFSPRFDRLGWVGLTTAGGCPGEGPQAGPLERCWRRTANGAVTACMGHARTQRSGLPCQVHQARHQPRDQTLPLFPAAFLRDLQPIGLPKIASTREQVEQGRGSQSASLRASARDMRRPLIAAVASRSSG